MARAAVADQTIFVDWPVLHDGQRKVEREWKRYNVLAAGRRWGKTKYSQFKLAEPCREGYPTAYFAPSYKLLMDAFREMKDRLGAVLTKCNEQEKRMELLGGGSIDWWTLEDEDAGRGRRYKRVVIDEAGLVPNLGSIWVHAIRPTLADYRGDALFGGTPKGRNYFWKAFMAGLDKERDDWACWQMPTSTNPHIQAAEIEDMRREMTERGFSQEVMAQFLEDGGMVFRFVRDAIDRNCLQEHDQGKTYYAGLDLGKVGDYTVLTIMDGDLTVRALERYHGIPWPLIKGRVANTLLEYGNPACKMDSTGLGDPVFDDLSKLGLNVHGEVFTNAKKQQWVDGLAIAFEQKMITIPDNDQMVAELEAYEAVRLPSGRIRYGHPENFFDDYVDSLALANENAREHAYDGPPEPEHVRLSRELGIEIKPSGLAHWHNVAQEEQAASRKDMESLLSDNYGLEEV